MRIEGDAEETTTLFTDPGGIILSNIDNALGDEGTDNYDQLAFIAFSLALGEFTVSKFVGKQDTGGFSTRENIINNGSFANDELWVFGSGWSHNPTEERADHSTGTAALSQSIDGIAVGVSYVVQVEVTGRTAGSLSVTLGGATSAETINADGTSEVSIVATDTTGLFITPTSDFDGSLPSVSVFRIVAGIEVNSFDSNGGLYVAGTNRVLPAMRSVVATETNGVERLVGCAPAGFNCFVDMPRLDIFSPETETGVRSDGVLGLVSSTEATPDLSQYRNGQYLGLLIAEDGTELVRGFIHDYESGNSGVNGETLAANEVQLCRDLERTLIFSSDGDTRPDARNQRLEIRRQVIATATRNRDTVNLSYDLGGNEPAEVADQYFVHSNLFLQGLGDSYIYKVATQGGNFLKSLDNDKTVGDQIILTTPWEFTSGATLLQVDPLERSVFFSRASIGGDNRNFEITSQSFILDVKSESPLVAVAKTRTGLLAMPEANEIINIQPPQFGDPVSFSQSLDFDIQRNVSSNTLIYNGTCKAPNSVFNTTVGFAGWVGSNDIYIYDGGRVSPLIGTKLRELWDRFDQESIRQCYSVVDTYHYNGPVVMFFGFKTEDGTNDQVLAYHLGRNDWLDFSDQVEVDAATGVVDDQGRRRIITASNSRLFLSGLPAQPGVTKEGHNVYASPSVQGTRFGVLDEPRTNSGAFAIRDNDATFSQQGNGLYFEGCNIQVAIINQNHEWQFARITGSASSTLLYVTPDDPDSWPDNSTTDTWRYVIGPRPFNLELPYMEPTESRNLVKIYGMRIDATDNSSFDWPLRVRFYAGGVTPGVETLVGSYNLSRAALQFLDETYRFSLPSSRRVRTVIDGISPPDSHIELRQILMEMFQT